MNAHNDGGLVFVLTLLDACCMDYRLSPAKSASINQARADVAALIAERDALRETLRDIATNCRRGAHEYGMTQHGVSAIAAMCDAALATGESA